MRRVLASALLLLSACPVELADDGCLPKPGFAFPTSVGTGSETIVTTRGVLSLAAPPVTCIPKDPAIVSVTATISGGGQPARMVPSTITLEVGDESTIRVDLSGVQPGEYSLQIFVEPTIAALNNEVIIAIDRSNERAQRFEPSCSGKFGRTSLGTSICSDGSSRFLARMPDGRSVTFTGVGLSLARDVLWLERTTDAGTIVERHVERSPGQFERTHLVPVDGEQVDAVDEGHVWAGKTFATVWEDGGVSIQRTPDAERAKLRIVDDGRGLEFRLGDEVCEMDGGCWSLASFRGREIANVGSKHVWFEPETDGVIRGLVRPLTAERGSAITSHALPNLRLDLFTNRAFRLRAPAALVMTQNTFDTLLIERRDGVFELWKPERGWTLRDATDAIVEFDVAAGQTAVFLR